MKLVPVETVPYSKRDSYGKYRTLVEEFLSMDVRCVRIENLEVSTYSTVSSINSYIKRHGMKGVKAITRNGQAYMTK